MFDGWVTESLEKAEGFALGYLRGIAGWRLLYFDSARILNKCIKRNVSATSESTFQFIVDTKRIYEIVNPEDGVFFDD